ncbi:MAG: hypothetical protein ACTSUF_03595 [Candidatus Heimdallarchaeaceae archaeon]
MGTKIRHGGVSYMTLDSRYYIQTQLNSTIQPSGASLIGVADAGGYFTSTNVEGVLQELAGTILPGNYLRLDGTNIPTADFNWTTNLTTTGIITAEQITSTDDITMSGLLTNTLSASDNKGLIIDGTTNPYTGTSNLQVIDVDVKVETAASSSGVSAYGMDFTIENDHVLSGSPTSSQQTSTGITNTVNLYANHTATPSLIFREYGYGIKNVVTTDREITGGSTTISAEELYGIKNEVNSRTVFNNTSKKLDINAYGLYNQVRTDNAYRTAGTLNINTYGSYNRIYCGTGGDSNTAYGVYVTFSNLGDTNYAFYNATSGVDYVLWSAGGDVELTDGNLTTTGTITGGTLTDGSLIITGGDISQSVSLTTGTIYGIGGGSLDLTAGDPWFLNVGLTLSTLTADTIAGGGSGYLDMTGIDWQLDVGFSATDLSVTSSDGHFTAPTARNSSPYEGDIRCDTTNKVIEFYDGSDWQSADCPKVIYASGTLSDGAMGYVSDATNWNTDNAIIKHIKITTSSTDWDLTIYSDSDGTSGMFGSIDLVKNANGNLDISLDLPYKDNDGAQRVHLKFTDNAGSNTATCLVMGIKAR